MKSKIKITGIALILLCGTAFYILSTTLKTVPIGTINLATLNDGVYHGSASNFIIDVELEVEIQNHTIAAINLIKHDNGLGEKANSIITSVLDAQTLDVDMVSGATYSSNTILKAIENSLTQGDTH